MLYSKTATVCQRPPRVFLSTISFLHTLHLGTSGHLKGLKHRLLIVDGFHQCYMQGLMFALAPFDCVVLAGNNAIAPPMDRSTAPVDPTLHSRHAPVLPEPREQSTQVVQRLRPRGPLLQTGCLPLASHHSTSGGPTALGRQWWPASRLCLQVLGLR